MDPADNSVPRASRLFRCESPPTRPKHDDDDNNNKKEEILTAVDLLAQPATLDCSSGWRKLNIGCACALLVCSFKETVFNGP